MVDEAEEMEAEEDENDEEPEEEDEPEEPEPEAGAAPARDGGPEKDADATEAAPRASPTPVRGSPTPLPPSGCRPAARPAAVVAKLYDIVPTMAAPQSTNINALAITPDLRFWITGGSDCYVRKYDGAATINGKQLLTVAQRHPFVDSVVKAGVLMSYWENEEPSPPSARGAEEHILSPVYSLAVHSQALWLLAGTESGGINLQSLRHDEGKRITCMQRHSNAVSVLQLAPDEKSVLSGSWDKNIFDWDLNNGQIKRQFDGSGGQISALELRPANGAPIPLDSYDEPVANETLFTSNMQPLPNGVPVNGMNGGPFPASGINGDEEAAADPDAPGSPAHESLFGSPGESLFGGDNDTVGGGGGNPFGDDNDNENEFSQGMEMTLQGDSTQDGMNHTGDLSMADIDMSAAPPLDPEAAPPPAVQALSADHNAPLTDAANGHAPVLNGGDVAHTLLPASQDETAASTAATQAPVPSSPNFVLASQPGPTHFDPTQSSDTTFFSAGMDGTIRIWDRRVALPVARIANRPGVPPWCMGACWSPDGNWIYAGRRNGIVEEFNIHKARSGWQPERVLKLPGGSGPVSAVRAMVNGRHLVW